MKSVLFVVVLVLCVAVLGSAQTVAPDVRMYVTSVVSRDANGAHIKGFQMYVGDVRIAADEADLKGEQDIELRGNIHVVVPPRIQIDGTGQTVVR